MKPGAWITSLVLFAVGCNSDFAPRTLNGAPVVRITAPNDQSVFEDAQVIEFQGLIQDANGMDDLASVLWFSDVDGDLGEPDRVFPDSDGRSYLATHLSPGVHAITLEAIDFGGDSASTSIGVVVGASVVDPVAEILSPDDFDRFEIHDDIDFVGIVSDPNEPAEQLRVTWVAVNAASGESVPLFDGNAASNGTVDAEWLDAPAGTFEVTLTVTDSENHTASAEVFILIADPDDVDADLDGFTINGGDCDDGDAQTYPGAPEQCVGKDNDCNTIVDDKDLDLDFHIDQQCVAYNGGAYPINDCDDTVNTVYGGAPELQDGLDNDCDSFVDEGTVVFDDDGDCACESGPCVDGINRSCATLISGDCDDSTTAVGPDAFDDPGPAPYLDSNCDGIDGDKDRAVFVSTAGTDSGRRCSFTSPCRTIQYAIGIANAEGYHQVFLRKGTYTGTVDLVNGIEIFGGYDTLWRRGPATEVAYEAKLTGGKASDGQFVTVRGRSVTGVLLSDLLIVGPNANELVGKSGKGSYGAHLLSSAVEFSRVRVQGGAGAPGGVGSNGSNWNQSDRASGGSKGENGYQLGWGSCSTDDQNGGAYGNEGCNSAYGAPWGGRGGNGGQADTKCDGVCGCASVWPCDGDCAHTGGDAGSHAAVTSGSAGTRGGAGGTCTTGAVPGGGNAGRVSNGGGGTAGDRAGVLSSSYWYTGTGGTGGRGLNGGGGGGGGGSGGCNNGDTTADAVGAGGGGGASGGCRSENPGSGGGGGGGSFGIFAMSSSISVTSSNFTLGTGGRGGDGGYGGAGQPGGTGGGGGNAATGVREGGRGGDGGHGGHAGGGGGGAGGSVFGIYVLNTSLTNSGNQFDGGTAGSGGSGGDVAVGTSWTDGNEGSTGEGGSKANTRTCATTTPC